MNNRKFMLAALLFVALPLSAQVILPRLIRDSMVLQRDIGINIWGWASKGEKVTVHFNGHTYHANTGKDGKWKLAIRPTPAGGPYTMQITGKNRITLREILVGDVWLCSGQSNMEHQMALHSTRYASEIAQCNYPRVRQFKIPKVSSFKGPQQDLPRGYWKAANPADVRDFSAVAFFFARSLHENYKIPIGIINATWGGSTIDAWISEEGLHAFPEIVKTIGRNRDTVYVRRSNAANQTADDKGLRERWFDTTYSPRGWRPIAIPGYWEDQGIRDLDGVVWYRREIEIPVSMTRVPAKLFLGRVVDADEVYINGKPIGTTGYLYPQRRYPIADGMLKPGKNLFVIRVTNHSGKGGFVPDKPYMLIAGPDTIDLAGYWNYKVGQVHLPLQAVAGSGTFEAHHQPSALYNAMIAPVVNYGIRGFLWYQGESDTWRPEEYARLQPALISDWRNHWQDDQKHFLFVQLPGFGDYRYLPAESAWAAFREAQSGSLAIHHTAMAIAIDLGEWNDIHPDRKKDVGVRLAEAAASTVYGNRNILPSGPLFESATIHGNRIIVSFTHTSGTLATTDGEAPQEFAIAGEDKKFTWAKTKIEGDKLVVWSDEIHEPKYVRYAWADNPVNPNLCNGKGQPASPFRTDTSK